MARAKGRDPLARLPKHGDRLEHIETGETATMMDLHEQPKHDRNCTVLPDRGPKTSTLWALSEFRITSAAIQTCARCGDAEHRTWDCPAGTVGERPERKRP